MSKFTTDAEGDRAFHEIIFKCSRCGYQTSDVYTAGVINDLGGECPVCGADALATSEGGFGIWTEDGDWYTDPEEGANAAVEDDPFADLATTAGCWQGRIRR